VIEQWIWSGGLGWLCSGTAPGRLTDWRDARNGGHCHWPHSESSMSIGRPSRRAWPGQAGGRRCIVDEGGSPAPSNVTSPGETRPERSLAGAALWWSYSKSERTVRRPP